MSLPRRKALRPIRPAEVERIAALWRRHGHTEDYPLGECQVSKETDDEGMRHLFYGGKRVGRASTLLLLGGDA